MHSGRLELADLTYTRLEDNLIRHRGDRLGQHQASRMLIMAHDYRIFTMRTSD